jgi:D-amino-acid dehydrogenase
MRVAVIGAGVVGTTTALQLATRGHEVTVLEAANAPAQGASFANAGLISPGHSFSWASPGVLHALGGVVAGTDDAMGIARWSDPALWPWGLRFLRECTAARWRRNSAASVALSAYSRTLQVNQREVAAADYGHAAAGIVYLLAPGQACDAQELALLDLAREPYETLDSAGIARAEPLLAPAVQRFGAGILCRTDATGNARTFTERAAQSAQALGAQFHFGQQVQGLQMENSRVTGIRTAQTFWACDAVVMAGGLGAATLSRPLGYRLPIYPVTGYSVTYAHHDTLGLQPRMGAVSLQHKIAWASFGKAVRFTGFADIGIPRSHALVRRRMAALERFAASIYAPATTLQPRHWTGQRPMTPDGLPILGRSSRHANLFFNCGHGAMGWTMASGSAQLVCDQLDGLPPAIDLAPYRCDRF